MKRSHRCQFYDRKVFGGQVPHLGSEGMRGAGLSHDHRRLLQRFRPELLWAGENHLHSSESLHHHANNDTIGFFIAKFVKT